MLLLSRDVEHLQKQHKHYSKHRPKITPTVCPEPSRNNAPKKYLKSAKKRPLWLPKGAQNPPKILPRGLPWITYVSKGNPRLPRGGPGRPSEPKRLPKSSTKIPQQGPQIMKNNHPDVFRDPFCVFFVEKYCFLALTFPEKNKN